MTTKTKKENTEPVQAEHVHGPNCNHDHGHHHHHHEPLKPIVRAGTKIGRNDPCLCGSQKKYKKCCGK